MEQDSLKYHWMSKAFCDGGGECFESCWVSPHPSPHHRHSPRMFYKLTGLKWTKKCTKSRLSYNFYTHFNNVPAFEPQVWHKLPVFPLDWTWNVQFRARGTVQTLTKSSHSMLGCCNVLWQWSVFFTRAATQLNWHTEVPYTGAWFAVCNSESILHKALENLGERNLLKKK